MDNTDKEVIRVELGHLKVDVEELKVNQRRMILELSKYKGVMGGIMLAMSAMTACATLVYKYIQGS